MRRTHSTPPCLVSPTDERSSTLRRGVSISFGGNEECSLTIVRESAERKRVRLEPFHRFAAHRGQHGHACSRIEQWADLALAERHACRQLALAPVRRRHIYLGRGQVCGRQGHAQDRWPPRSATPSDKRPPASLHSTKGETPTTNNQSDRAFRVTPRTCLVSIASCEASRTGSARRVLTSYRPLQCRVEAKPGPRPRDGSIVGVAK